jgi:uncharacterized membrane-anchored protein YitT (DUF2179 family)
MFKKFSRFMGLSAKNVLSIATGTLLLAFAMINIHGPSKITEGGILGLSLLIKNITGIDQSITAPILDGLCYLLGFAMLGKRFLKVSLVSSAFYAGWLFVFEQIGPFIPSFYDMPFIAVLLGGLFVGIGASLVIMQGGASGGDDALALVVADRTGIGLSKVYFLIDFIVLCLSLSYIPFRRLIWSYLTTLVSSWIIGQFEIYVHLPRRKSQQQNA